MTGEGMVYREKDLDRSKKMELVAGRVDIFPVRGISHSLLQGHKNESEDK